LGVRVAPGYRPLDQAQWAARLPPSVQARERQPTPPRLVLVAHHPPGVRRRQSDQTVAGFFLRAYAGSGLGVRRFARRHPMPSRLSAWRMVSPATTRGVHPLAWQTSATRSSVQRLVGLPNARGRWCRISLSGSAREPSNSGWAECGREDFSRKQSSPSRAKAWIALRTVGLVQRRARAMADGAWPSALAKRIWQRRAVNASAARRPVRSACRCSGLSGGTKSWGCMTHYSHSDGTDKDLPCPFTRTHRKPTCPAGLVQRLVQRAFAVHSDSPVSSLLDPVEYHDHHPGVRWFVEGHRPVLPSPDIDRPGQGIAVELVNRLVGRVLLEHTGPHLGLEVEALRVGRRVQLGDHTRRRLGEV